MSLIGSFFTNFRRYITHISPILRYFGEMDRPEATRLLTGCEDGTFLVRISKNVSRMGEYSLSVVYHHPRHIRIHRNADTFYYLCSPQPFQSLEVRRRKRLIRRVYASRDVTQPNLKWHTYARTCACARTHGAAGFFSLSAQKNDRCTTGAAAVVLHFSLTRAANLCVYALA